MSSDAMADRIQTRLLGAFQEFGNLVLRRKRDFELRITQKTMAARIGVTQAQISRYESEEEIPGHHATALAVAKCYNLTADQTRRYFQLLYSDASRDAHAELKKDGPFDNRTLPEYIEDIDNQLARNEREMFAGIPNVILPETRRL